MAEEEFIINIGHERNKSVTLAQLGNIISVELKQYIIFEKLINTIDPNQLTGIKIESTEERWIREISALERELRENRIREFIKYKTYIGQTKLFEQKPLRARDCTYNNRNMFMYHPDDKVKCIKKEFKRRLP